MNAPSQWETTLHCNVVSHWRGAFTKWTLQVDIFDGASRCDISHTILITITLLWTCILIADVLVRCVFLHFARGVTSVYFYPTTHLFVFVLRISVWMFVFLWYVLCVPKKYIFIVKDRWVLSFPQVVNLNQVNRDHSTVIPLFYTTIFL